jgi:hypothetical protein
MALFGDFFKKRKMRKQEVYADQQYLDAVSILQESMETYLELLARARSIGDLDCAERLESKLNSVFQYFVQNWDGDINITHTISSNCYVKQDQKRLKLE